MKSRPYRHLAHLPSFKPSPIVFLTVATFARRPVLHNPTAFDILRGLWTRSAERNNWTVGYFLLMPDHVHLFARPGPEADRLSVWIGMWKSVSARQMARRLKIKPPLWQEDYFDRYLRSVENYSNKWRYVQENPVRAGLVRDADLWPYQGVIEDLSF